jgi:hypothetical protein
MNKMNKNSHGLVMALDVVNAALAKLGVAPIKKFYGRGISSIATMKYHPLRRNLLAKLCPEFAIKHREEGVRPYDMLRDLGDGRYVADVEDVVIMDDEFMKVFVDELAKSLSLFIRRW